MGIRHSAHGILGCAVPPPLHSGRVDLAERRGPGVAPATTGEPRAPARAGEIDIETLGRRRAHSVGEELRVETLRDAWLINCANEFPARFREAASLSIYRVFTDTEESPPTWARIHALARSLATCLLGHPAAGERWDHPVEPPARLYVVCKQGLNRSGLVTGRILRALGVPVEEAVAAVRAARPGALNNQTFERLVRE